MSFIERAITNTQVTDVRTSNLICALACAASIYTAISGDWTRFRGPEGNGLAPEAQLPVTWSESEGIVWKTALPGEGGSSPVILQDRIYLTGYSGYDRWEKSTDFSSFKLHVFCIGNDGKLVWTTDVPAKEEQRRGGPGGTRWTGYAAGTAAVDESGVYVSFGHNGVFALSHDGRILWQADAGKGAPGWGYGASPVLAGDKLIVNAACESESLIAFDKKTGKEIWKTGDVQRSWATPLVSGEIILLPIQNGLGAFALDDGRRLWFIEGGRDYQTASPLAADDVVYYSVHNTHRGVSTKALKLGDGTPEELWSTDKYGAVCASPLLHDGKLYWTGNDSRTHRNRRGVYCADAKTGEILYLKKLEPMPDTLYASPLLAGNKIYYTSLKKGTYVIQAGPEFKQLAHNVIAGDDTCFNASPTPYQGRFLLLRSDKFLYCIGGEE